MSKTMWRFIHISDPHLGSDVDGEWNNRVICTMMPYVISCLRRDLSDCYADFLLVTGDIVSHHSRDAVFAARDLLDSLGTPYYPMGGNHDFVSKETREWFLEAFYAHLPNNETFYSFTHKNLHFCVLDAWWKWADGTLCSQSERPDAPSEEVSYPGACWAIPPHELKWLKNDLEAHKTIPTFIAVHYPAVPIPDRMRRDGIKDAGSLGNGPLLIELLEEYPQVRGIFSGHVHMHFIDATGKLVHIVTGSMPEFPCEYREIQVHDDRLEIFTRELSDTSFAARSLLPGREWARGEEQDRRATIPLF